jgi:ParB family chromosome partitioning protein
MKRGHSTKEIWLESHRRNAFLQNLVPRGQHKLVQITTAHGQPAEGSPILPRNQYVAIREDQPQNKFQREVPEYKICKCVTEAIVVDGAGKGELRNVCADPNCPVHHPKRESSRNDVN